MQSNLTILDEETLVEEKFIQMPTGTYADVRESEFGFIADHLGYSALGLRVRLANLWMSMTMLRRAKP